MASNNIDDCVIPKNNNEIEEYIKFNIESMQKWRTIYRSYEEQFVKLISFIETNLIGGDQLQNTCEYGTSIQVFHRGKEYLDCFVSDFELEDGSNITSLTCQGIGLREEIYSNRSEYYINGAYHSRLSEGKILDLIRIISKFICIDKMFPSLYEFIKGDEEIAILDNKEFEHARCQVYNLMGSFIN